MNVTCKGERFDFSVAENVAVSSEYDEDRGRGCLKRAGFGERLVLQEGRSVASSLHPDWFSDIMAVLW